MGIDVTCCFAVPTRPSSSCTPTPPNHGHGRIGGTGADLWFTQGLERRALTGARSGKEDG